MEYKESGSIEIFLMMLGKILHVVLSLTYSFHMHFLTIFLALCYEVGIQR